jgi:hypothetical protein
VWFAGGVDVQLPFLAEGAGRLHVRHSGAHAGDPAGVEILLTQIVVPVHSLAHLEKKARLEPAPNNARLRLAKPGPYWRTRNGSIHL